MVKKSPKSLDNLKEEEEQKKVCTDCGCTEIIYDNGERFCKKCGLLME